MYTLDVETIRRLLADRNIALVARRTGVNPNTLYRILNGKTNPRYDTLKKLSEYLAAGPDKDNYSKAQGRIVTLNFDNFKAPSLGQIAKEGPRPLDFIWDGFPAGVVGALVSLSPGGVGKSYFALEAAVAVAGGCDLLDLKPQRTGRVVYFDAQNEEEILIYRMCAISKYLSQEQKEAVAKNLVVKSVYVSRFNIMRKGHLKKFIEVCAGSRLVILDPVSSMHYLNEDRSSDAARLLRWLEYVTERTGATILFLKNVYRGSALVNEVRWRGFLRTMTTSEAMALADYSFSRKAISEERCHLYVYFASESDYDVPSQSRWLVRVESGVLRPAALRPAINNMEVR